MNYAISNFPDRVIVFHPHAFAQRNKIKLRREKRTFDLRVNRTALCPTEKSVDLFKSPKNDTVITPIQHTHK